VRPDDLGAEALLRCCGSEVWAQRMLASRPFGDAETLHRTADEIWFSLRREDWLEAFSKHPKIGDKASSNWSAQEQQGMSTASEETARRMRELNEQYERKFGWRFIVCATGKPADEMRSLLEQRLSNDPDTELRIAADEQAKIMHLRLDKLLAE
jgi:OHCU decarboxylase